MQSDITYLQRAPAQCNTRSPRAALHHTRLARATSVCSSVCAPAARCSAVALSASLWLSPSLHGTKIMPSAQRARRSSRHGRRRSACPCSSSRSPRGVANRIDQVAGEIHRRLVDHVLHVDLEAASRRDRRASPPACGDRKPRASRHPGAESPDEHTRPGTVAPELGSTSRRPIVRRANSSCSRAIRLSSSPSPPRRATRRGAGSSASCRHARPCRSP